MRQVAILEWIAEDTSPELLGVWDNSLNAASAAQDHSITALRWKESPPDSGSGRWFADGRMKQFSQDKGLYKMVVTNVNTYGNLKNTDIEGDKRLARATSLIESGMDSKEAIEQACEEF